jgi:hypothetical protein
MDTLKKYYDALTDKYLISMSYVEGKPVPEQIEKKYIIYNDKDGSMDYTQDPAAATIFGFILGTLIVATLKKECKDLPNLQFDLQALANAEFIKDVQGKKEAQAA